MIVRPSSLKAIDFGGLSIFDYTADADRDPPWRSDKYYLVVKGELEFSLRGDPFVLGQRDFCFIEQGKRSAYANRASSPASLVLVHTPNFELDSEVFVRESAA
jgi:mannose-6-phosphate isomerase-like protein (cupin superfamily)